MSTSDIEEALQLLARLCSDGGHASCDDSRRCTLGLRVWRGGTVGFDATEQVLRRGGDWPDPGWSTAALLTLVRRLVALEVESISDRKRVLLATSALARLAERGLGADVVLRTCLRRDLRWAAYVRIAAAWSARDGNAIDPGDPAAPLVDLLEEDPALRAAGSPTIADALSAISAGAVSQRVHEWVSTAAVTHVLGWKLTGFMKTDVVSDDSVLPAGEGATVWVFERLTKTYLDEWSRDSLEWELAYLTRPGSVRMRLGVHDRILEERYVALKDVLEEISSRLVGQGAAGEVVEGLTTGEVIGSVVQLIRIGRLQDAAALTSRAARQAPGDARLVVAHGFCLIPTDRIEAARILWKAKGESVLQRHPGFAVEIDLATLALLKGDLDEFEGLVRSIAQLENPHGWFWDPVQLLGGSAKLSYYKLDEWVRRANEAREIVRTATKV